MGQSQLAEWAEDTEERVSPDARVEDVGDNAEEEAEQEEVDEESSERLLSHQQQHQKGRDACEKAFLCYSECNLLQSTLLLHALVLLYISFQSSSSTPSSWPSLESFSTAENSPCFC